MLTTLKQNDLRQIRLNRDFVSSFQTYHFKCYSCFKLMTQAHLHVIFLLTYYIKHTTLTRYY